MAKKKRNQQQSEPHAPELPPGVKLLRTLEGHTDLVLHVGFDPTGRILASASKDETIRLWDVASGKLLRTLKGHDQHVLSAVFDPRSQVLASGGYDETIRLWDVASGKLLRTLKGKDYTTFSVAFSPDSTVLASGGGDNKVKLWDVTSSKLLHTLTGHENMVTKVVFHPTNPMLASASSDCMVRLWDVTTGKLLRVLKGHTGGIYGLVFDPIGWILATGSSDHTVRLWDVTTGKLLRVLEGHTQRVTAVGFSMDGGVLASKSAEGILRLWNCETWELATILSEPVDPGWSSGFAFHPILPMLAIPASSPNALEVKPIRIWELNYDVLLSKSPEAEPTEAVHHTTAKIVLVGDSGVGKTGLGWKLAHGEYKEHSSTHGQQFWVLDQLSLLREDKTQCEAILWDLAGQPDYRLTHALFLDDADLALVLFDPTDSRDPLHGVEFWLKQLKSGRKQSSDGPDCCPTILIGARADRGEARLTQEELDAFCRERGIAGGYLTTSAKAEIGLDDLLQRMKAQIQWDQKAITVTTATFKRIKDYVLGLKENRRRRKLIVSPEDLRKRLQKTDKTWQFTDAEMMTAVGHLANYGYVRVLHTTKGEKRILLAPELLNNLAASFVLEARRNLKGLGALEEQRLLGREYEFRELDKLFEEERDVLLDSAALLFLEHNVCFRETDPLNEKSYLVFPELINLKKPLLDEDKQTEEGVAYTASGAVENVYASLVVLLGYTQTFTRTNQWRSQARYEVGDGLICGFRQEGDAEGELNLVLYFGANVGQPVRTLFQGLFESFLARRNLSVFRFEPVVCSNGHALNRAVVREKLRKGSASAFCSDCGERLTLPKAAEPIQLSQTERRKVDEQRWFAEQRTQFEQAVFRVTAYVVDQKLTRPECFISYAWGDKSQERWVERSLATDLQKAGINVVLDQWENARVGASVSRFLERIVKSDRIIVIGTPRYRQKYENKDTATGYVVAAEVDLIANRLMGTEAEKETVMPVLLAGEKRTSLPPLLHNKVYADFRTERAYFITAFDLILDIYGIAHGNQAVADLRETLRKSELR